MKNIAGTYRHYKGNHYEVIDEATHTETGERYVVYKALYEPFNTWIRPYDMFFETVIVDGQERPRFKKIEAK